MSSIEFPLLYKRTSFGLISDPTIQVTVPTPVGDTTHLFLIDTGADFSLAPRGLARQVGLDWDNLPEAGISGIEQGAMRTRLGLLPIRLDGALLTVRCLFADTASAPLLLGRADFLDRFALTIDTQLGRVILTELG